MLSWKGFSKSILRKCPKKGNEKFDASGGGGEFDFFSLPPSEKRNVTFHFFGRTFKREWYHLPLFDKQLSRAWFETHIMLYKHHEVPSRADVPVIFWRPSRVEVFKFPLFRVPPIFREIMYALFYHSSVVPYTALRGNNAILMPINSNCRISSRLSSASICELEKRRR